MSSIRPMVALFSMATLALVAAVHAEQTQDVPVKQLGSKYRLVGRLHVPLGEVVTVQGVQIEGPFKGYAGGPNLRVQRIQGMATQEDIQIRIAPYFNKWGEKALAGGNALPELKLGKTYEMEGYQTGSFVGVPNEAYQKAGISLQTTGHYFQQTFVVYRAKEIEPLSFGPGDFAGRQALLEGKAKSENGQSHMLGNGWTVVVDDKAPWPIDIEGKTIETYGAYKPEDAPNTYRLVDGNWHLVRLADQLGRQVELRGRATSKNGEWWFNYRGTDLYVEHMSDLPGWTADNHWCPMIISGVLETVQPPRLEQIALQADRDLSECYIVRQARWEPLPELLWPEVPLENE